MINLVVWGTFDYFCILWKKKKKKKKKESKRRSCAAICGRCDAALARFLADPPGIALAV